MTEQIVNIQQGFELGCMDGSSDHTCTVITLTEIATKQQWILKHIFSKHEYPDDMNDEDTVFLDCYHAATYTMHRIETKGIVNLDHWYTEQFWAEDIYPKTSYLNYVFN